MPQSTISIRVLSREEFRRNIPTLLPIHLTAMGYPSSFTESRAHLWRQNADMPDFVAAAAYDGPTPVGITFAFQGGPDTWWYSQVARGLAHAGHSRVDIARILMAYAELAELHVLPSHQNLGIGRELLHTLFAVIPQTTVMLSTPEVAGEESAAWQLYRSEGFDDVLRHTYFGTDPRPFAVLARRTV